MLIRDFPNRVNLTIITVVVGQVHNREPSHVVSVKQYRTPGKGKNIERKISVLIKELVEIGMLKETIPQAVQTTFPLGTVSLKELFELQVSVIDN